MSRQQLHILRQMARDGVDPKKPYVFVDGRFVQVEDVETKISSEPESSALTEIPASSTNETQVGLLEKSTDVKTPEEPKKKKPFKPKSKQENEA